MSKLTPEQEDHTSFEFVKLVLQLAELERLVKPKLPAASQKLVSDLIDTGVSPKTIAKLIGRSPSYVQTIRNGQNGLSAALFYRLVKHALTSGQQNANRKQ